MDEFTAGLNGGNAAALLLLDIRFQGDGARQMICHRRAFAGDLGVESELQSAS